jgi:ribose transport system substrate-binding protein
MTTEEITMRTKLFRLLICVALIAAVVGTFGTNRVSAQDDGRIKIGALSKTEANEFFLNMKVGYEFAAARYGVEVVWGAMPTEGDTAGQLALLESWIAQGDFDGFVVTPFTATNLNSALAQISASGIPIVNIDELIPTDVAAEAGINIATRIASDNRRAGALVAEALMAQLEPGSKVAILEGVAGSPASINRSGGFQDAVGDTLEIVSIQPADYERSKALPVTTNILQVHPDLRAIFAVNDTMALGAVEAVQQAGFEEQVIVYGVDAIPEAVDAIRAGTLAGSVAQYPNEMAVLGVETLLRILQDRPVTPTLEAPILLITAENADRAGINMPDPAVQNYTIGGLSKTEANEFFLAMKTGYERAASELGVTVEWGAMPTEGDTAGQLALLESWIARGDIDAYCVTPFTANNLNSALAQVSEAGVPILNIDELIPADVAQEAGIDIAVRIASDNRRAGALVAEDMLAQLEPGAQIAILEGVAGSPASINRSGGFQDAVGDQLNIVSIQAADYERSKALPVTTNILQVNPELKAIFAVNDTMALGAAEAVAQAELEGQVLVYGVDAIPEALEAIEAGTIVGSVAQYPDEMAYLCVQNAIKVIEGRPVTPNLEAPIVLIKKQ